MELINMSGKQYPVQAVALEHIQKGMGCISSPGVNHRRDRTHCMEKCITQNQTVTSTKTQ